MAWNAEAKEEWWMGYCFLMNSIIGAGVLAIPWAYANCGWVLGSVSQIIVFFMSISSSYLFLSTWSRVECIAQLQNNGAEVTPVPLSHIFSSVQFQYITCEDKNIELEENKPQITDRKFDINEIAHLTMGKTWSHIMIGSLACAGYPALIAYISIFSTSMASNVPLFGQTCNLYDADGYFSTCKMIYWGYLAIFSSAMIILSCFHIAEQKWMQYVLLVFRFLAIFLMLITCIIAVSTNSELEDDGTNEAEPKVFDIYQIGTGFFIIMLASLFENNIPTTTGFVKNKEMYLTRIINCSCVTFSTLYLLLGLILAFSIEDIEEMISLNWRNYSAGSSEQVWWTYIISYLIVLLPAIDVCSSFPLIAGNLADNFMCITYGHQSKDINHKIFFTFRMIVVVPSIVVGIFVYELGIILEFAGVFSLIISGVLIPLMAIAAQKIIPEKSKYDFKDNYWVALMLIGTSVTIFMICMIFLVIYQVDNS